MDTNFLEDFYGDANQEWRENVLEDTKLADEGFETFSNGKESFDKLDSKFKSLTEVDTASNTGTLNTDFNDNMVMNILNPDNTEFLNEYSDINEFGNTTKISDIKRVKNENILPDVSLIKNHVPYKLFQENRKMDNFNDSIDGIIAPSVLSGVFFSRKNIDNLHNKIIVGIKKILNYDIEKQSEEEIKIIMRSIYLQFSKNTDCDIQKQVKDLNKEVLNYSISNIYTNIKQYLGYIRNISEVSDFVMPSPEETNIAGNKKGYRMDQLIDHDGGIRIT